MVILLLLAACQIIEPLPDDELVPVVGVPAITDVSLTCDLDAGRWRIQVETDAWTGGGSLLWTVDGDYLENHDNLRSIRAGAQGLEDTLRLDIDIVTDWRLVGGGGSTVFTCRDTPTALVWVRDLEGEVTDCRWLGGRDLLTGVEGLPDCAVDTGS